MSYVNHYRKWHNHDDPNYVRYIKRKFTRMFENYLPETKDAAILEIGCANGMALNTLKELGYTNLLGLELDAELAKTAKSFSLEVENLDATVFIKETKIKFDFIYLFDVLEHFEPKKIPEILTDLYHILNENGKLMIVSPNAASPAGAYFRYIDWTHQVSFTPTSISYLLEEAGFKDITISDESSIEEPREEDYTNKEWFDYAKSNSEKARFYEAFARWQMKCMFGPNRYNLLVAPNMKIGACKRNVEQVDIKIQLNSEDLFDLKEFSEQTSSTRLQLEDIKNALTIKQEDLSSDVNRISKDLVYLREEINKQEKVETDVGMIMENIGNLHTKINDCISNIKKHKELIQMQNFENNLETNHLVKQTKSLENLIINFYKKKLLSKRKKIWWKILFSLKSGKYRRIIQKSGLFDREYYLKYNLDVREAGIDPINHYLIHGFLEGRNPSKEFDTNEYIRSHPELLIEGINPLIHKIIHK